MALLFHFLFFWKKLFTFNVIFIFFLSFCVLCVCHTFLSHLMTCFANKVPTFNALHCLFDVFYWHSHSELIYIECVRSSCFYAYFLVSVFFVSLFSYTFWHRNEAIKKEMMIKRKLERVWILQTKKSIIKIHTLREYFRVMWMRCDLFVTTESIGELRAKRLEIIGKIKLIYRRRLNEK